MDSEEAVSDQRSAIGTDAADPLAEAHCRVCGYSLRGLPENRCPECGTPFDPETYTGSFSPLWPSLMIWYLAAYLVITLINFGWLLHWALSPPPPQAALGSVTYVIDLRFCLEAVLAPAIVVVAILGLRGRRDWGRKACIALQLLLPAAWLASFWLVRSGYNRATLEGKNWQTDWSLPDLVLNAGMPPLIIVCVLLTGLRPRSLSPDANSAEIRLPLARYRPRQDWPLVMIALLATVALKHLHGLVESIVFVFSHGGRTNWTNNPTFIGYMAVNLITAACYAIVAVRVWRHPAKAPGSLVVAAVILPVAVILGMAAQAIWSKSMASFAAPQAILYSVRHLVTAVLPVCAMMMFLRREPLAITQVELSGSPASEQPAHQ